MIALHFSGIDRHAAFTRSDLGTRDIRGDVTLHGQVIQPSDTCAQMALTTGGSFFDLQTLTDGRVRAQKAFVDVFSRRVAKTLHSEVLTCPK